MGRLHEFRAALMVGILSALAQPRHALLVAIGFLLASSSLLGLLTIPAGIGRLAAHTGRTDVAVVDLSNNTQASAGGMNTAETTALIANLPGVVHDASGRALVAPQFEVNTKLRRRDGALVDVRIRGVTPLFWKIAGDSVHMHGAPFKPGIRQLVAGRGVIQGFAMGGAGSTLVIRKAPWRVVGDFDANGSLWESELWTDIGTLQAAWNKPASAATTLWVKLTAASAYPEFVNTLERTPGLSHLSAARQTDVYRWQIGYLYKYAAIAAWAVSGLLGAAAALAIANALSMSLTARRRNLAIMLALGFRPWTLAAALVCETVLIGLLCSGLIVVAGMLLLDGQHVSSATWSQSMDFSLAVNAEVICATLGYTTLLGIVAAFVPVSRTVGAPLMLALQKN